jgi:hypothetical protein
MVWKMVVMTAFPMTAPRGTGAAACLSAGVSIPRSCACATICSRRKRRMLSRPCTIQHEDCYGGRSQYLPGQIICIKTMLATPVLKMEKH